jgi:hypothetical protein
MSEVGKAYRVYYWADADRAGTESDMLYAGSKDEARKKVMSRHPNGIFRDVKLEGWDDPKPDPLSWWSWKRH